MSSTSNLSTDIAVTKEYFEKRNLEEREFVSSLLKNAQKPIIPDGHKDVVHFHRWNKFGLAEDVNEGVDPATGEAADITEVKVELAEIAKHISIPKYGDAQRFSSLIEQAYDKFAEQAERTINRKMITYIEQGNSSGNNSFSPFTVRYAGNKNSAAELTADDSLTVRAVTSSVMYIQKQGFSNAGTLCVSVSPWGLEDLMVTDDDFRQFVIHGGKDYMETGKIGRWAGAMFEIQHEPFRCVAAAETTYAGAGDIVTTYVYVKGISHGVVQFSGFNGIRPKFKVQDISTTGAAMTIGYRVPQGTIVLNPNAGIRLKSKNSNNEVSSQS